MPTVVEWGCSGCCGVDAGRLRTWNRLRGLSVQRVASPGFVEIEGTARALENTVTTPMTDTESLVYEYAVSERRHNEDGGVDWRTINSDNDSVPFVIETDSDSVVVDAPRLDGEDTHLDGTERQH